jgi:hypothetical protein
VSKFVVAKPFVILAITVLAGSTSAASQAMAQVQLGPEQPMDTFREDCEVIEADLDRIEHQRDVRALTAA